MGLISMLRIDIDAGVEVYKMTKYGVLIDVRTKEEYDHGHIPNSINLPLSELDQILKEVPDKNTPLFVYCQSGSRSARAVKSMKKAGYSDVTNIGGILYYHGPIEK
ncbi:rhodanese-like domain-containing protein [Faecalicoccus acidiformans]|uniref:Rhodanese-like domain-containing protein n=1 Tax=Faecalicoccus acidiformans TaxID=915173 RepID=A0ABS2FQC8_9FIRM|nr:rhodanese-like domain-containing protein [Faecalicoccus acidiformans]MBM6831516.1 rhodanese-like domain-containing protein [Faecalicoccus acidiformans]